MEAIALRRTKDMTLVGLPPKTIEICYVELSFDERQMYDQLKQDTKIFLKEKKQVIYIWNLKLERPIMYV